VQNSRRKKTCCGKLKKRGLGRPERIPESTEIGEVDLTNVGVTLFVLKGRLSSPCKIEQLGNRVKENLRKEQSSELGIIKKKKGNLFT